MNSSAAIAAALGAFVQQGGTPGCVAILITPAGSETIRLGRVAADDAWVPDERTRFGVASVTKLFTGILFADLLREGRVRLDDPASRWLPRALPRYWATEIALRHLTTHTSALPVGAPGTSVLGGRLWTSPRVWRIAFRRWVLRQGSGPLAGVTTDDLLAWLADYTLPRAPGAQREYSNIGFGLLGEALGKADGRGYEAALRARVIAPLGLRDTVYTRTPGAPALHELALGPLGGAGGLISTAADLAVLARAVLGASPRPLAESIAMTLSPVGDVAGSPVHLAWAHEAKTGRLYHTGMSHAFLGVDLKRKVAAVVLLVGSLDENEELGLAVLDRVAGGNRAFPTPRVVVELSAAALARYSGTWRLDAESSVVLTATDKGLKAQFMKGGKPGGAADLWPSSEHSFFCKEWDCRWDFEPAAAGVPTAARVRMYAFDGTYRRVQ